MRIKQFEFTDRTTGWHLEPATFDSFNLLVGISGVGKSKIVKSLRRVQEFAVNQRFDPGAMEWAIAFEHQDKEYRWEGCTEREAELGSSQVRVEREKLSCGGDIIAERSPEISTFQGSRLPKLSRSSSLIALLADEDAVAPASLGFFKFVADENGSLANDFYLPAGFARKALELFGDLLRAQQRDATKSPMSREAVSFDRAQSILMLYLLQELKRPTFARIRDTFIEIFPAVEDLQVVLRPANNDDAREVLELHIREHGVEPWIPAAELSSGMLRSLSLIVGALLALPGSVLVVDEVENSLGVNCMPQILDLFRQRTDCQFILTSHHPYIINNLPMDTWKLVRRRGSNVRIDPATSFPGLDTRSHHRAFTQLINLPEFEEGIA